MTEDPGESVLILSQTMSFNAPMCNENILGSCEHFLFAGNVSLFNLLISSVLVETIFGGGRGGWNDCTKFLSQCFVPSLRAAMEF